MARSESDGPSVHEPHGGDLSEEAFGVVLQEYGGRWVAVDGHCVVEAASTLDELLALVADQERRVERFKVSTLPFFGASMDVEEYGRLVSCGKLDGRRVELVEGKLISTDRRSPAHAAVVMRLLRHLQVSAGWVQAFSPIEVPPDSVPEPALALLAEEPPTGQHARAALLVIEVTLLSHQIDRGAKVAVYARAGVPVYWLVNVPAREIEVMSEPTVEGYARHATYGRGELVPSPTPGIDPVRVDWVFERVEVRDEAV